MNRLWIALGVYVLLAGLTLVTIDDQKFRLATLAILAFLVIRTLSHDRRRRREEREREEVE